MTPSEIVVSAVLKAWHSALDREQRVRDILGAERGESTEDAATRVMRVSSPSIKPGLAPRDCIRCGAKNVRDRFGGYCLPCDEAVRNGAPDEPPSTPAEKEQASSDARPVGCDGCLCPMDGECKIHPHLVRPVPTQEEVEKAREQRTKEANPLDRPCPACGTPMLCTRCYEEIRPRPEETSPLVNPST